MGPGALIPRPDTEILVEGAADHGTKPFSCGLDLCCGPGTLGLTLSSELGFPFDLVDVSEPALGYARKNLTAIDCDGSGAKTKIHQMDLLSDDLNTLPKVDLIAVILHIDAADMETLMPEVRCFEPHLALCGGGSGLDFFITLLGRLHHVASEGCRSYVELGHNQRPEVDQGPCVSCPVAWSIFRIVETLNP